MAGNTQLCRFDDVRTFLLHWLRDAETLEQANLTLDSPLLGTTASFVEFGGSVASILLPELELLKLAQGGTARRHKRNPATTTRDLEG